jgi:hypothetical protein
VECLCVVVVVVVVVVLVLVGVEEVLALPPQPATTRVAARAATIVSMAVSGVLFMGRAPNVMRGFGRSPYQAFTAQIAIAGAGV